MTAPTTQPDPRIFPVLRMLAWLTAATAVMGTLNALVLPRVFGGRDGIAEASALMAIVGFIAGVASAVPLYRARDSAQLTTAFFTGMAVRFGFAVVAVMVAVFVLKLPDVPTIVAMMLVLMPILFIETRFIIRHIATLDAWLKQNRSAPSPSADSTATQPPARAAEPRQTPGHSEILA